MHLQKACSQIYTRRLGLTEPVSLGKYIRPGYILLDMEAEAKEKLIHAGCRVLEEAGCITPDYYQEILNREAISSTEIGNGVAIPHGIENHVLIPAVYDPAEKEDQLGKRAGGYDFPAGAELQ